MTLKILGSLVGAALAVTAAGCGDNNQRCGEGTVENDGLCVPDGTVTCGQGTVLDESSGECVTDPSACAEGTVLVDGQCVPEDDTLSADLEELTEPNDGFGEGDDIAGMFDLPAIGADGVVIHGCINPYRDLDADGPDIDWDMWLVTATGPSVVELAADGVHGLSAGFVVIPVSENLAAVADAGWLRIGANLAGDTSQRQVYLPGAGTYALVMSDTRSIFFDGNPFNIDGPGSGTEESCYYTTISQVAIPAATPVAADATATGNVDGDVILHSYDPIEGDLIDIAHDIQSDAAGEGLVVMRNNTFFAYGEPAPFIGGLFNADTITFVVDPIYNYALTPRPYTLTPNALNTNQLPIDGTTLTVTHDTTTTDDWNTLDDLEWSWFDVGAGEVVQLDMDFNKSGLGFAIVTAETGVVSDVTGLLTGTDFYAGYTGWFRFPEAGRYYLVSFEADGAMGDTYAITSTVSRVVPTPITIGTPIVDAPFSDLGSKWFTLDPGTAVWLSHVAGAVGFGGDVDLWWYDQAGVGEIDNDIPLLDAMFFNNDGSDLSGRIVFNDPINYLIQVQDDLGDATGTATVDLAVANRVFTDAGTLSPAAPIALADLVIPANTSHFVFFRGTPGHNVVIEVTPASDDAPDLGLVRLTRTEGTMASADDPEVLELMVPATGWIALEVFSFGTSATSFDLAVTATLPLPFTDICAGQTNVLAQTPVGIFAALNDEAISAVQTLPAAFNLYGDSVTSYYVGTNGFLSFQTPANNAYFSNGSFPSGTDPDGVIAPYWDDLDLVTICKLDGADRTTIQWRGLSLSNNAGIMMQAVLHTDGTIDFIYGSGHLANGSSGTVGAENQAGTLGDQFGRNTAGVIVPTSSITFTTVPPP